MWVQSVCAMQFFWLPLHQNKWKNTTKSVVAKIPARNEASKWLYRVLTILRLVLSFIGFTHPINKSIKIVYYVTELVLCGVYMLLLSFHFLTHANKATNTTKKNSCVCVYIFRTFRGRCIALVLYGATYLQCDSQIVLLMP